MEQSRSLFYVWLLFPMDFEDRIILIVEKLYSSFLKKIDKVCPLVRPHVLYQQRRPEEKMRKTSLRQSL